MVANRTDPYLALMLEYETKIDIDAPAAIVWEVLSDLASWPQWDPFCERIEAKQPLALGAKLKVFSTLSPGRGFSLRVTTYEPGHRMVWTGGMPLGLFRGQRTYLLAAHGERTHFEMCEVFSGPMLKLIAKSIPDMTEAFDAFAAGLKARAEQRVRQAVPTRAAS